MAQRNLPLGGAIPMEPGERDRIVIIQKMTDGKGTSGFPTEAPSTLAAVPMRKADMNGSERYQAEQLSAPFNTRWEMGYRADMDPELVDVAKTRRLVYQGRAYDIVEAHMIGRREGIELLTLTAQRSAS
jgi:SPP1 family predicted phage head-tail adaptor